MARYRKECFNQKFKHIEAPKIVRNYKPYDGTEN